MILSPTVVGAWTNLYWGWYYRGPTDLPWSQCQLIRFSAISHASVRANSMQLGLRCHVNSNFFPARLIVSKQKRMCVISVWLQHWWIEWVRLFNCYRVHMGIIQRFSVCMWQRWSELHYDLRVLLNLANECKHHARSIITTPSSYYIQPRIGVEGNRSTTLESNSFYWKLPYFQHQDESHCMISSSANLPGTSSLTHVIKEWVIISSREGWWRKPCTHQWRTKF